MAVSVLDGPDYDIISSVGIGCGLVFAAAILMLGHRHHVPSTCPDCAKSFFHGLFGEIGPSRRCAYCGIEVGTTKAAARAQH